MGIVVVKIARTGEPVWTIIPIPAIIFGLSTNFCMCCAFVCRDCSLFCREFSLFCRGVSLFCRRFLYSAMSFLYFAVVFFFLPWQLWATVQWRLEIIKWLKYWCKDQCPRSTQIDAKLRIKTDYRLCSIKIDNKLARTTWIDVILVLLLLTLRTSSKLTHFFYSWLRTCNGLVGINQLI